MAGMSSELTDLRKVAKSRYLLLHIIVSIRGIIYYSKSTTSGVTNS
jgi:hypothetical protein